MPNTQAAHKFDFIQRSDALLGSELFTDIRQGEIKTPFGTATLLWAGDKIFQLDFQPKGKLPKRRGARVMGHKFYEALRQRARNNSNGKAAPNPFEADDVRFVAIGTKKALVVWQALTQIPSGSTVSYGDLALRSFGNKKAARPCAAFVGANPISWFIPCHRVIGASGKLTGYGGGLDLKKEMLSIESAGQS